MAQWISTINVLAAVGSEGRSEYLQNITLSLLAPDA